MSLISCAVNLTLVWSSTCVIIYSTGAARFAITDTKLYVQVVTLSTPDNAKLLQQLRSSVKKTINWNNYQSDLKKLCKKPIAKSLTWYKFSRSNKTFCIVFRKWKW